MYRYRCTCTGEKKSQNVRTSAYGGLTKPCDLLAGVGHWEGMVSYVEGLVTSFPGEQEVVCSRLGRQTGDSEVQLLAGWGLYSVPQSYLPDIPWSHHHLPLHVVLLVQAKTTVFVVLVGMFDGGLLQTHLQTNATIS